MAKRPLFDLIPRNSEIHNFTSVQLTDRQSRVLGMGLKFRPSLRPPSVAQFDLQIKDLCRRVRLQDKFVNCLQDTDFKPRHFTSQLAGIHREKTQNLKTNSSLYARSYAITSQLTYRTGRTILQNRSEKNCKSWNPTRALKFCLQIKTWGLHYCLRIGFRLRQLSICMTTCHIVKSRNRTGMKAVLMLLTLAKSFYLFIVDLSPLT